ncbi:MAG TPA: Ig-like domain-containing protein, partial [Draconibacterium sp.]|nr:Ig-like domain-containing protein [Draconibacterium sp.]
MKTNIHFIYKKLIPVVTLAFIYWGCERELDDLQPATFPKNPEVFIDGFSAGLNYAAFGGSVPTAFDVDNDVTYNNSKASMRFDVPNAGDPEGAYAGGVFSTEVGRDLSGYNALTFWAKASQSANLDLVGLGNDLGTSKYQVTISGLNVSTSWKKYIIPLPDPSKLTAERGMFFYSVGPSEGKGYSFWIDELKFENLGTIAHRQPMILNGNDEVESAVNGLSFPVDGLGVTFNMPTGVDQTVNAAPAWFSFLSSNEGVASVDANGLVTVLSEGTAVITATSGGDDAKGSLTVQSSGDFTHAPVPTAAQEDVISIFSNAYTNVPVDYYNGYWQPYQTTTSADFKVGDDDVLFYTNFNFVGIQFTSPTINATSMTHLHMDIWIPNEVAPSDKLSVKLVDMGPDGALDGNDPTLTYEISGPLASQSWISVDINLSGLSSRSKLAQIIFERIGTSLSGFYLDNVYLLGNGGGTVTEHAEASPIPPARNAADVISVYGDVYKNLEGTDYPDWGQATVVSDVQIAGNNTLK